MKLSPYFIINLLRLLHKPKNIKMNKTQMKRKEQVCAGPALAKQIDSAPAPEMKCVKISLETCVFQLMLLQLKL
jgi:hypothetical protein